MKSATLPFALIYCCTLFLCLSCRKDFNSSGGNGIDTTRLLKEFRIYFQPGMQPDSIITQVSYDTVKRTIVLKQYFDGYNGGAISWKYTYNAGGYLTSVYDITGGGTGNPIITVFYDGNNEINRLIAPLLQCPKRNKFYFQSLRYQNSKLKKWQLVDSFLSLSVYRRREIRYFTGYFIQKKLLPFPYLKPTTFVL